MQVQSIGNTNSNTGFKSRKNLEEASAFVNMDDSQLRYYAYESSIDKKEDRKHQNSISRTLYAIPVVETLASGILAGKDAALSVRTRDAGRTALSWTVLLGAVGLYNAVKNAVVSKSPTLQQFNNDHPVAAFLTDIGFIFTGFILGSIGLLKLNNHLEEKHPEQIEEGKKELEILKDEIDNTKFNTEILPKISARVAQFEEKAPKLMKVGKIALANSIWILAGVALLKSIKYTKERQEKADYNYEKLKGAQFKTAKQLVNVLSVERDVLAQNELRTAKDLRKSLTEEKVVSDKELSKICDDDRCCEEDRCCKEEKAE